MFGKAVRAYRLGYRELPAPGKGWLRISLVNDAILCELCPLDSLVPSKSPVKQFVCWWDDPNVIASSPFLRAIRQVNKPLTVLIDDSGNLLEAS